MIDDCFVPFLVDSFVRDRKKIRDLDKSTHNE